MQTKKSDPYEYVDYCRTLPVAKSSVPLESKLDEVLLRVKRIDQKLSNMNQVMRCSETAPGHQPRLFPSSSFPGKQCKESLGNRRIINDYCSVKTRLRSCLN